MQNNHTVDWAYLWNRYKKNWALWRKDLYQAYYIRLHYFSLDAPNKQLS